jgi:hypothetical protein
MAALDAGALPSAQFFGDLHRATINAPYWLAQHGSAWAGRAAAQIAAGGELALRAAAGSTLQLACSISCLASGCVTPVLLVAFLVAVWCAVSPPAWAVGIIERTFPDITFR